MLPYLCKWWFGWQWHCINIIADWCSEKERHLEWSDVREHGLRIFSSNYLGFGCWMLHLVSLMNIILLLLYIYLLSLLFWFLVHSSPSFCSSLFLLYDKINISSKWCDWGGSSLQSLVLRNSVLQSKNWILLDILAKIIIYPIE